jgi:hypothetical protein
VGTRAIAHGRRTEFRAGAAIGRPRRLAICHGRQFFLSILRLVLLRQPSSLAPRGKLHRRLDLSIANPPTSAVVSLHWSPLRTVPARFPIHAFSSTLAVISTRSLFPTTPLINHLHRLSPLSLPTALYQSSPSSRPALLANGPLLLSPNECCVIIVGLFTAVIHVRSAGGFAPRLLAGALLEESHPRPTGGPSPGFSG